MAYFVQYDETGTITGTVMGATAPIHPRQLEFAEYLSVDGKQVNLTTLTLEDIPV